MDDSTNDASPGLPARKKGRERRQQIIDAAKEVLMTSGITSLVLRDIAVQLGITHGNLQYYFPTKEDLLVAIFDQELLTYTDSCTMPPARRPRGRAGSQPSWMRDFPLQRRSQRRSGEC